MSALPTGCVSCSEYSWRYLLVEEFVTGCLDRVLGLDAANPQERFLVDEGVADGDRLVALQQFVAGANKLTVLGDATFRAGLVGIGLPFELGALCVLRPCDGGGFLVGGLPFLKRLVSAVMTLVTPSFGAPAY